MNNILPLPLSLNIGIPAVRSMKEARVVYGEYDTVLTTGPHSDEVKDIIHLKHKIVTFDDVVDDRAPNAPTYAKVVDALEFGIGASKLLVHCHAGISRSAAIAWGVAIGNGFEPSNAYATLESLQPMHTVSWKGQRPFFPNDLIVFYIDQYFGLDGQLAEITKGHRRFLK